MWYSIMQYTLYIILVPDTVNILQHVMCIKSNGLSWPCAHHEDMWEGGGILVLIFNIALGIGELLISCPVCFMPLRNSLWYPLSMRLGGPEGVSACFGEEENCISMTGIGHSSLVIQLIAQSLYQLRYPTFRHMKSYAGLVTKVDIEDLACKGIKYPFLGTDESNMVLCVRPFVVMVTSWLTNLPKTVTYNKRWEHLKFLHKVVV